jgi:hypothetical protein
MATFTVADLSADDIGGDVFVEKVMDMMHVQDKIHKLKIKYELELDDAKKNRYDEASAALDTWRTDEIPKIGEYLTQYLDKLQAGAITSQLPKSSVIRQALKYCLTQVKESYCIFLANNPIVGKCNPINGKKRKRRH